MASMLYMPYVECLYTPYIAGELSILSIGSKVSRLIAEKLQQVRGEAGLTEIGKFI